METIENITVLLDNEVGDYMIKMNWNPRGSYPTYEFQFYKFMLN